jgi:CNT family concentrative nucleoside transporter
MAGIAGTVMVLYASLLGPVIPDALGNILMAAVISTPAALAVAALMVPFRPDPTAAAELAIDDPPVSSMDAVAKGTRDGIVFLLNIVASLVVMVALVSLVNSALGLLPQVEGEAISLQRLFAYAFRPVMWLIGISGEDTAAAATLMGTKTVLNEFIAYVDLAHLPPEALSQRSRLIMTYALCGFCQFRQPRHPDRRHGRDGAGTPGRDRLARAALDPVGDARHLYERRGGGPAMRR